MIKSFINSTIIFLWGMVLNTAVAFGAAGFIPEEVSSEPVIDYSGSRGWQFARSTTVRPDEPLYITHIGVYDHGGDGLALAHPVGLWRFLRREPEGGILLASGIVPAGTEAPLIDGYRYTSIEAVVLPPGEGVVIGAHYSAGDIDDLMRPVRGRVAPEFNSSAISGLVSLESSSLTMPVGGISRGLEGLPNYEFYPVNVRFEVIPEASTVVICAVGAVLLFSLRRCQT